MGFAPGLGVGEGFVQEFPELPAERPVKASHDDAHYHNAAFYLTSVKLQAGHVPAHNYGCGWRFLDIPLSPGQVFNTARLYYKAASTIGVILVNLRGEANANPATFSDLTDYYGRTRTTAGGRTALPAVTSGTWYSVDVKDIIEEIIALAAWSKGNPIVIFFDVDTYSVRYQEYHSYDADPDDAAYLKIT